MKKDDYLNIIAKHFPRLRVSTSKLISHGYDHDVLIINDKKVFRFPNENYHDRFKMETKLMNLIAPKSPVRIPHYDFISDAPVFGTYNLLQGRSMIPSAVMRMAKPKRLRLAEQLGSWISYLHSFRLSDAKKCGVRQTWYGTYWGRESVEEQYQQARKFVFQKLSKDQKTWVQTQYEKYLNLNLDCKNVLIHDDLHSRHILYNPINVQVTGILDFTDADIGDGALDCGVGWAYGDDFAMKLFESYDQPMDRDFIERSQFPSKMHPIKQMIYFFTDKYRNITVPPLMKELERNMKRFRL